MIRSSKGFTLTEFIVGVLIIALAIGILIPNAGCGGNFIKAREKAREAETKSNLHSIQIALEKYALDTGGDYPLILYGGDKSDTFTTADSPPPSEDPDYVFWPEDVDVLISGGYLPAYPRNAWGTGAHPSGKQILTDPAGFGFDVLEINPARVNLWAIPNDRAKEYVRRSVGGAKGNLMWDVSEGQRHPPFPIIVRPDPAPSPTGYLNPADNPGKDNYADDYQTIWTPGNFYYYALFDGVGGYTLFVDTDGDGIGEKENPVKGEVVGFNLVAYGTIFNPGFDYYNLYGDYADRSLMTMNNPPDLEVGPDGRRDGVILKIMSGVDRRSAADAAQIGDLGN